MKNKEVINTTIGDLASAFYEEALAELGDERLANVVTARLLEQYLSTRG